VSPVRNAEKKIKKDKEEKKREKEEKKRIKKEKKRKKGKKKKKGKKSSSSEESGSNTETQIEAIEADENTTKRELTAISSGEEVDSEPETKRHKDSSSSAAARAAAAYERIETEAMAVLEGLEKKDLTVLSRAAFVLEGGAPDRQEAVANAIACLTVSSVDKDGSNKAAVGRAGVIPSLVALLKSMAPGVQKQAARALHNATSKSAENKAAVSAAGAIPQLCVLMKAAPAVRDQAIGILRNLTGGNADNKAAVAASGCIPTLVNLLKADCPPEVLVNLCVVLYNLCNDNADRRVKLAEVSVIDPLVKLMSENTLEVRREAADVLRALSINNPKNCAGAISAGAAPSMSALLRAGASKQAIMLKDHLNKYGGAGVKAAIAAEPALR